MLQGYRVSSNFYSHAVSEDHTELNSISVQTSFYKFNPFKVSMLTYYLIYSRSFCDPSMKISISLVFLRAAMASSHTDL